MRAGPPLPIREYCIGIFDGPHATPAEAEAGPVFLGIKNITSDGRLDFSETRHLSEEDYPRWTRRVTPQFGDVVFTYEATLHRYALIPEGFRGCLGRRVALLRPDPSRADSRYLLYYLLSRRWREVVEANVVTGATVDRIPLERLPSFPVTLPDVRTQRRVAEVLSAYDDLIENNRRRMILLEDAARELYREWFVRLRFPGHEHVRTVDGLPEGWDRRPLGACAAFRSGGTPSKARSEYWEGDIPWVSSGEMTETRIYDTPLHITAEAAAAGSRVVTPGSILIVVRGMSLAKEFRIATVAREMAFNQDLKALEPLDGVDALVLFHQLLDRREAIREMASEASHGTKKLDTPVLERLPCVVPDQRLQALFADTVAPSIAQRDNLFQQNIRLRSARDLLLPRLLSGELAV
jgi:type I restriction enzyme S subunit